MWAAAGLVRTSELRRKYKMMNRGELLAVKDFMQVYWVQFGRVA